MTNETEHPIENYGAKERTDPQILQHIDEVLKSYGISDIEENEESVVDVSLPVVPNTPRVRNPEKFIEEHKRLLDDLGIEHDTKVHSQKRVIKFLENGNEQELLFFTYEPDTDFDTSPKPIVLFSHGGGIGGSSNERSAYLRVLSPAGLNKSFLGAPDHRGSASHLEKTKYSLVERNVDLLVSLRYLLNKYKEKWNGQVYLFGDSMGGHVSSVVAGLLEQNPKLKGDISLILTEPATYVKDADSTLWTNFVKGDKNLENILNTENIEDLDGIGVGDILIYNHGDEEPFYIKLHKIEEGEKVYKVSPILSALEDGSSFSEVIRAKRPSEISDSYALEFLEKIERVLLIQMLQDEVVTGDIRELFNQIVENKPEGKIVNIPASHQATHVDEVRAIVDFVNNEKV
jgi:pimeloyl-ACP methyl ester carboxylesterase